MTDIAIGRLSAGDPKSIDEWIDTVTASQAELPDFPEPSRPSLIASLVTPAESTRNEWITATVDGRIVGAVEIYMSLKENLRQLEFEMDVHPGYRRRGVGSALFAEIERFAAEHGRTVLHNYTVDTLSPDKPRAHDGQRFLESKGFKAGLDEIHRSADLDLVPEAELDVLLDAAWAKAEGYELVQWTNRAPDDVVDAIAYLDGRLLQDSPTGTLDIEPQNIDAARVREGERRNLASGGLKINTAVRHIASGTVAGWTEIHVPAGSERHCWQGVTIVDPEHRGHRIGTILKIVNHRHLRSYRPRMAFVHTWNAEANDFMININEAVGYRAQDRWIAYEKKS